MKQILQSLYVKSDIICKELSNASLLQLILKVVYSIGGPTSKANLISELNGILDMKIGEKLIETPFNVLIEENKLVENKSMFQLSSSIKKKFDQAFEIYRQRQKRIYENWFSKASSKENAIENWFENVTIKFFLKYKNEWVAEKTYKTKTQSPYEGLKKLIKQETSKDVNIDKQDKEWLVEQYLKFFNSNDSDLDSVFWDYGTAAYSSSLIKTSNTANQVTVDLIKDSTFILDTNILMHLPLEAGEFYNSYKALADIFEKLNITPGYFYISREEYINSVSKKKEQILKIIDNYEDVIIDDIKGDFVRTAKARFCNNLEDYEKFFETLINPPEKFINGLDLSVFDNAELQAAFENAKDDEELKSKLNTIYLSRQKKLRDNLKKKNKGSKEKEIKGKKDASLVHDAGLIKGAEHIRQNAKCFILTRDITVKQYGVDSAKRDDPSISIGLDTLISLLAIHDGGVDMNPDDFKPLFAKIIKLSLLPDKNTLRPEDLARLLDIEQDIARLPYDDVKSIVNEAHNLQLNGESKKVVNTEITRSFQRVKMNLKSNLEDKITEVELERSSKNKLATELDKTEKALKASYEKDIRETDKKWLKRQYRNLILIVIGLIILTYGVYYIIGNTELTKLEGPLTGIIIEIAGALIISFWVIIPRIKYKYKKRVSEMQQEIERRINAT